MIELTDWTLALTGAGEFALPPEVMPEPVPALVPGTVAAALEAAGRWTRDNKQALHDRDVWYQATIPVSGSFKLDLDCPATLVDVFVGDRLIGRTEDAFIRHSFEIEAAAGVCLSLCFRGIAPALAQRGPRAGWRVPMIPAPGLRLLRTPMFAHMPGWSPEIDIVGPVRGVNLRLTLSFSSEDARISTRMDGSDGIVRVSLPSGVIGKAVVSCGAQSAELATDGDHLVADLRLAEVQRWWPNGCGQQALYPVNIEVDGISHDLGRVGFREITVDRGPDGHGFGLIINGSPVFARGACWTTNDIVGHRATRDVYEPWLKLAAEAGMTMIRVGGTMIPPSRTFYDICDELGLMVWQEFPFANFDYPAADPAFAATVTQEAAALLAEIGPAPSLAVLCGGSEVLQQAAMMGLPETRWPGVLFDEILSSAAAAARPDVPYVPNSPSGGPLPFVPNRGIAHYYGVGAYMRPLEDARRAEVTFAAECLAFSNVPDAETLAKHLPYPAHDPRWKARVPRDLSASWDFEDVREHYLGLIFGVDPQRLRREDATLHADLSRVVTGHVMAETFAEWRRGRSPTKGALVWTLMDLLPGAGWGVIDSTGRPKAAWYALKRAFRPVQLSLTDEGTNGLSLHLVNESAEEVPATLSLTAYRDGTVPVVARSREIVLAARQSSEISAFDLIGSFFDISYAYRFGPPGHDVTVARLIAADGKVIAEAFHHPLGLGHHWPKPAIEARLDGGDLILTSSHYTPFVHVEAGERRPDDDWFALVPGVDKRVRLIGEGALSGHIATPGDRVHVPFGA